jgi:hypothetical protein
LSIAGPLLENNTGREMLGLSLSVDGPKQASGHEGGCMSGFMQPAEDDIVPLPWL